MTTMIGTAITVVRASRRITRKELASRSGLSYPYVSELETDTKSPSLKAIMSIAQSLSISLPDLLAIAEQAAKNENLIIPPAS